VDPVLNFADRKLFAHQMLQALQPIMGLSLEENDRADEDQLTISVITSVVERHQTRAVMAGADLTTVKELMGHKTMAMTLRYSHLSPGHRRTAIERLVTRATTADTEVSALAE
jgi:mannose/fructose-specific phosphotransferase system component IIA